MSSSSSLSLLIIIILFTLSFSLSPVVAVVIRIPAGKVKCVSEDVDPTSLSLSTFSLSSAADHHHHNISASVTDPNGETIHLANNVESGQFVFVAETPGRYSTCFWSPVFRLGGEIEVDFEWKTGVAARRLHSVAKKGKIDAVETELKKLEDSVNWIYTEMRFLRQREEEAWKLNEDINSRMGILSLLSLVMCLGVAFLQMFYLKIFSNEKRFYEPVYLYQIYGNHCKIVTW